jgi:hypothetical protein
MAKDAKQAQETQGSVRESRGRDFLQFTLMENDLDRAAVKSRCHGLHGITELLQVLIDDGAGRRAVLQIV